MRKKMRLLEGPYVGCGSFPQRRWKDGEPLKNDLELLGIVWFATTFSKGARSAVAWRLLAYQLPWLVAFFFKE
ncbi:MAG: hypothetical protein MUC50_17725 [Myxococcota bacterium]|nr:hypothetical protein [Myxococcota bacterium]